MRTFKHAILPKGFKANGIWSGVKKSAKADLALLYSTIPAKASAQFTTNKIVAAPVVVSRTHLVKAPFFQAVLINSGSANCFTGKKGIKDASRCAQGVAKILGIHPYSVLVASTGIIGKALALNKIIAGFPALTAGLSMSGIIKASQAILTTDTCAKVVTARVAIGNAVITLCGIAKGAGMIAPNMATMLAFIMTDASLTQGALDKALRMSVDSSFNCITVDGCMSTNDTVMILANGACANTPIRSGKGYAVFAKALQTVCLELAKMIIMDAEGATKFIIIRVREAKNFHDARRVALAIANSNLFKAAMYGQDPNFGRIAASIGSSGVEVKEEQLKVRLGPLNKKTIKVDVGLSQGKAGCTVYTSDLTPEYVKINAAYN